jgi:hypothetical protein
MERKSQVAGRLEPSCLFPSDDEIARLLFGGDKVRIKAFLDTIAGEERRGLPRKHPTYGARYWPAVKAYFDYEWGLISEPPFTATADEAVPQAEEIFRATPNQRRPARKRA